MEVRTAASGYLPEHPPLWISITRFSSIWLLRRASRRAPEGADHGGRHRRSSAAASDPVAGRLIGNLSKGSSQRVGLGSGAGSRAEVIVLDEPTDRPRPASRFGRSGNLIRSLAGDRTVLLSSHILPEVAMTPLARGRRAPRAYRRRGRISTTPEPARSLEETFLKVTSAGPAPPGSEKSRMSRVGAVIAARSGRRSTRRSPGSSGRFSCSSPAGSSSASSYQFAVVGGEHGGATRR